VTCHDIYVVMMCVFVDIGLCESLGHQPAGKQESCFPARLSCEYQRWVMMLPPIGSFVHTIFDLSNAR